MKKIGRYGHFKEECILVSIVYHLSLFSPYIWVQLFSIHLSSSYNSSKNSYKFKVHPRQTYDSILSKILRTKLSLLSTFLL